VVSVLPCLLMNLALMECAPSLVMSAMKVRIVRAQASCYADCRLSDGVVRQRPGVWHRQARPRQRG
jgi:hypothetical protein